MDKRTILFMLCVSAAFFGVQALFNRGQKPHEAKKIVAQASPSSLPLIAQQQAPFSSFEGETFYVLENDYQQLVFSSRGGSLSEINLPFDDSSPKSLVKEIDFDREI